MIGAGAATRATTSAIAPVGTVPETETAGGGGADCQHASSSVLPSCTCCTIKKHSPLPTLFRLTLNRPPPPRDERLAGRLRTRHCDRPFEISAGNRHAAARCWQHSRSLDPGRDGRTGDEMQAWTEVRGRGLSGEIRLVRQQRSFPVKSRQMEREEALCRLLPPY